MTDVKCYEELAKSMFDSIRVTLSQDNLTVQTIVLIRMLAMISSQISDEVRDEIIEHFKQKHEEYKKNIVQKDEKT